MTQDFTKTMQDMMGAFPMDTSAMQDAFRTQAQFAERLSRVALDAAEQSTEISAHWSKQTLARMRDATTVRDDRSDYTKAVTDLAAAQAETTAETMARFAEVAKKVQMDTVELMLTAGKELAEDTAEQTRAVAARGRQVTSDMVARGQEVAEKTAEKTHEAVNKMAHEGKQAADRFAEQGKEATDRSAEQGKAATDRFAAQSKAAADKVGAQTKETIDATASAAQSASKAPAQPKATTTTK